MLAAPDKFRGSASAPDVAAAIAAAATQVGWSCVQLPLADSGEGTLDAFGGANRTTTVTGPLGRPVDAPWRMGDDGIAVVELTGRLDRLAALYRQRYGVDLATVDGSGAAGGLGGALAALGAGWSRVSR